MKLYFFKQLFLLSIIFVPFLFLDSIGAAAKFDRSDLNVTGGEGQAEYGVSEMLSDGSVEAVIQNDKDIRLTGSGHINLTISSGKLQLEVCSSCTGTSKVCFDTTEDVAGNDLGCSEFPSFCTFQVKYESVDAPNNIIEYINFAKTRVDVEYFRGSCLTPEIHTGHFVAVGPSTFASCEPKFDGDEKTIRLYVNIESSCPITVKNAQVHVPKILTTLPPKTTPQPAKSTPSAQPKATADAGFPWWAYLIIAIVCILALIVVIGAIVYFVCFKKAKVSKTQHSPPAAIVTPATSKKANGAIATTTTTAAAAPGETKDTPSSKRKADLNFTKFEPSKKSKKSQKKAKKVTTQEPTTTEDVPPAPGSRQPVFDLSNAPEPVYKPNYNPKPHRLVPRSMKSAKTDSLEKTLPKERMELIEPVAESASRHCIKSNESEIVQEVKKNYPEIKRAVLDAEAELVCMPVGKMFVVIDTLAREAEQKLGAIGCEIDEGRCITSVSEGARQYLQDEKCPTTTVYFAIGAEYHRYLPEDYEKMDVYSIPLLMVVALQRRFPDHYRRKACALMRRKMPTVLANYTEAARQKMPYPIPVIEKAYCREPKLFRQLSQIKTDSESEKRMNKMKEAGEKQKLDVKGGDRDS